MMQSNKNTFWRGKKVFLTGHTGFKGSWLSLMLAEYGATIRGFSLAPPTDPSLFKIAGISELIESFTGNVQDKDTLCECVQSFQPDIIFHLAAQPLVRESYRDPVETYSTNVIGTVNLLEAARLCQKLRVILNVTTDKCYLNDGSGHPFQESDRLGGVDPYSSSKACAELVTSAYLSSFFSESNSPVVATARAGNVIGGGDFATDRLIPDILRAFQNDLAVRIRMPFAVRPWQHVLEPLSGYLVLAEKAYNEGRRFQGGWNFGPTEQGFQTVGWIAEYLAKHWGRPALIELDTDNHPEEASVLKLDITKASQSLGWAPKWSIEQALNQIISWHHAWQSGGSIGEIMRRQIHSYGA